MTLPLVLGSGIFLLLAVGSEAQLNPCDPLSSTSTGDLPTLIVTVQEVSDLELAVAKNTGGSALDPYRGRIEVFGRLAETILLQLGDVSFNPMNCDSRFEIVQGATTDVFYLQLKAAVDRDGATPTAFDDLDSYFCRLRCESIGTGRQPLFIPLTITITDINDNPPEFVDLPYSTNINELTPVGTTVFRKISATDTDAEGNGKADFYILSGDGSGIAEWGGEPRFVINLPRQGFVTVNETLDFETLYYLYNRNYFNMTIQARNCILPQQLAFQDGGSPVSLSAETSLTITVLEGDGLPPMFVYEGCIIYRRFYDMCIGPELSATITSNVIPPGGTVATYPFPATTQSTPVVIKARDQDTLNYPITFSLVSMDYSDRFALSTPTKTNDSGVEFYEVNLLQTQAINRNDAKNFSLLVRAEEVSINRRFTTLRIEVTVEPANNFDPTLTLNTNQQTGYIYENSPVGTPLTNQDSTQIVQLSVTDQDLAPGDPPGAYSLSIAGSTPFSVSNDGYITVASNVLDFETTPRYEFSVVVRETDTDAKRSSTITFTASVLDRNDFAPTFPSGAYTRQIPAGDYTTTNFNVITVSATDQDSGLNGQVSYSITGATNGGLGKFTISSGGGTIFSNGTLTRGDEYAITVRATDRSTSGQLSGDTVVLVTVVASGNLIPQIPANQYDISVSEGVPRDSLVFTVEATDPDGNPLTYIITNGNLAGDFNINNNGQIRNANFLDRERTPSYSLTVEVRDNSGGTATTTVSISVTDINAQTNRQYCILCWVPVLCVE